LQADNTCRIMFCNPPPDSLQYRQVVHTSLFGEIEGRMRC
jgi:hypothetical protein